MTLAAARSHPWLLAYVPVYNFAQFREVATSPSVESLPTDASMVSYPETDAGFPHNGQHGNAGVSQGFEHLQLERNAEPASQDSSLAMESNIPGAFPKIESNGNGIQREGSRSAPLQRRSQVLSQAAEGDGAVLLEPSWEMLQNAASQEADAAAGPSTGAAARGNKRVHSELTPLPEEYDDAMDIPICDDNSAHKKGRSSDEDGSTHSGAERRAVNASRARGKGAPQAQPRSLRTRAGGGANAKADMASEDEDGSAPKPRRSSRQTPQKAARRS